MRNGPTNENAQPMRCENGHILGVQIGAVGVVKHAGRVYTGVLLTAHCRCGATWTNPVLGRQIDAALVGLVPALDVADLPEILPKVARETNRTAAPTAVSVGTAVRGS